MGERPMEEIIDVLLHKLCDKGLTPVEIPRLVKDVLYLIGDGGYYTVDDVNRHLSRLGWHEKIMDGVIFELILWMLENDGLFEVTTHTLH
jgi:hypothetical protein